MLEILVHISIGIVIGSVSTYYFIINVKTNKQITNGNSSPAINGDNNSVNQ